MQLDLFRRPVEPEDLERDVRRPWLTLDDGTPSGRLPSVDEEDPIWQRYGLGPVCDVPCGMKGYYEAEERLGL